MLHPMPWALAFMLVYDPGVMSTGSPISSMIPTSSVASTPLSHTRWRPRRSSSGRRTCASTHSAPARVPPESRCGHRSHLLLLAIFSTAPRSESGIHSCLRRGRRHAAHCTGSHAAARCAPSPPALLPTPPLLRARWACLWRPPIPELAGPHTSLMLHRHAQHRGAHLQGHMGRGASQQALSCRGTWGRGANQRAHSRAARRGAAMVLPRELGRRLLDYRGPWGPGKNAWSHGSAAAALPPSRRPRSSEPRPAP